MRLPHPLLHSQFFQFSNLSELIRALSNSVSPEELRTIEELASVGLPPITSRHVLATMFGINPSLIWSFEHRPSRHYRSFDIPKGRTTRRIDAPRVALKIVQKWMSVQLQNIFVPKSHVYGFVCGKSHIDAAKVHCNSEWVFSVDIKNFFQTTPRKLVEIKLEALGFPRDGSELIARVCCLRDFLAQGAPSSPVLSNICFHETDEQLLSIASKYEVRLSRYADDIVFSGQGQFPIELKTEIESLFSESHWKLSENKIHLAKLPMRLKVHGLLVHGNTIRLTKGYRNKLRAYEHLLNKQAINENDISKVRGHLNYGLQIQKAASI